jgi:hypothetical protein
MDSRIGNRKTSGKGLFIVLTSVSLTTVLGSVWRRLGRQSNIYHRR